MNKFLIIVTFLILLIGCKNKTATQSSTETMLFNFDKYQNARLKKFNLYTIPAFNSDFDTSESKVRLLDSISYGRVWQDTSEPYFGPIADMPDEGMFYYASVVYPDFNLVCFKSYVGDAGEMYELFSYTKAGRRIAHLEVASLQGEESDWFDNTVSFFKNDTIRMIETKCAEVQNLSYCDSIKTTYCLKPDGKFSFINSDTVLDNRLDSKRNTL